MSFRVMRGGSVAAVAGLAMAASAFGQGADLCADAQPISGEGLFAFDNGAAGTDGDNTDPLCNAFGSSTIDNDVWFRWTAPETGDAEITFCGLTAVDTKIAVYEGVSCPLGSATLDCNDDSCNFQSFVSFNAVAGNEYLLRVGTFPGATGGTGQFEITVSEPGPDIGPDVIVGSLPSMLHWTTGGAISGKRSYSVATTSCNIGSEDLLWIASSNQHPVIGQSLYRLADGRLEMLGFSWLKHGFFALSGNVCGFCTGSGGSVLNPGCSDPYGASLNGQQSGLGPRFEVNATTGVFPYPWSNPAGSSGDGLFKRIQVLETDLQTPNARYFVEGQYVTPDDAASGNALNNASYREVSVTGAFGLQGVGDTEREKPAIQAWADNDAAVDLNPADYTESGLPARFWVAAKVFDNGNGTWTYEYAVQNLNSHRSGGSFSVPVGDGATVTNIGFRDVDYHSGEPYDPTDWSGSYTGGSVVWNSPAPFAVDQNTNALRWGTMYNFRFTADVAPGTGDVAIGLFRPGNAGDPNELIVSTVAPDAATGCAADWNGDLVVDSGDFFDFIGEFIAGDADFNGDMGTDSGDFFDFIAAFLNGC